LLTLLYGRSNVFPRRGEHRLTIKQVGELLRGVQTLVHLQRSTTVAWFSGSDNGIVSMPWYAMRACRAYAIV
jgi:hypothetical protein